MTYRRDDHLRAAFGRPKPSQQGEVPGLGLIFLALLIGGLFAVHRVIGVAAGDPEIAEAVQRLKQDHAWLELDWRELEPLLKAIAEGHCGVDLDLLRERAMVFIALSHDHMTLEEACIYPQARVRLTAGERREAGREMAARRRANDPTSV